MGKITKKKVKETKNDKITAKNEEWDAEIKAQQRLFVLYYCTDEDSFLNGTQSYRKAYPKCKSDKTAASSSSKLLRMGKVKSAVKKLLKLSRQIDDEIASYKILKTYERLAFYNPADIITDTGGLVKPLKELGALAMCVEQIQTSYNKEGEANTIIKLVDRHKALIMLMKYLSIVRPSEAKSLDMPVIMISDKNEDFEIAEISK